MEINKFLKKKDIKKGSISVIFPIYGKFDTERLLIAIESVKNQKNVDVEIIVSEQGRTPKLKNKLGGEIKYIFKKHIPKKNLSDFNPGKIRNDAIRISSGEFIYTNDSDIVFMDENFLEKCKKLLESDSNLVLYRPSMRRLPLENFCEFKKRVKEKRIFNAIDSLNLENEFIASTDKLKRDLKVVTKNTEEYLKVFTTSKDNFQRYVADSSLKGKEPKIWSENLHAGGNFFRRVHFEEIGGYCEDFINWGCEDSDLQWKFKQIFNLQFFPKINEFTVIHLDHKKDYFSSEMWKRNEGICAERKDKGIHLAIKKDKEKWKNHN